MTFGGSWTGVSAVLSIALAGGCGDAGGGSSSSSTGQDSTGTTPPSAGHVLCACVDVDGYGIPEIGCPAPPRTDCGVYQEYDPVDVDSGGQEDPPEGCVLDDEGEVDCEMANAAVVDCVVQAQQQADPFTVLWAQTPEPTASRERRYFGDPDALVRIAVTWNDLQVRWDDATVRATPDLSGCAGASDAQTGWQCFEDTFAQAEALGVCVAAGEAEVSE